MSQVRGTFSFSSSFIDVQVDHIFMQRAAPPTPAAPQSGIDTFTWWDYETNKFN